jgi:hypothetical protein
MVVEWKRILHTVAAVGTPGTPLTLTARMRVPGAAAGSGDGGV